MPPDVCPRRREITRQEAVVHPYQKVAVHATKSEPFNYFASKQSSLRPLKCFTPNNFVNLNHLSVLIASISLVYFVHLRQLQNDMSQGSFEHVYGFSAVPVNFDALTSTGSPASSTPTRSLRLNDFSDASLTSSPERMPFQLGKPGHTPRAPHLLSLVKVPVRLPDGRLTSMTAQELKSSLPMGEVASPLPTFDPLTS